MDPIQWDTSILETKHLTVAKKEHIFRRSLERSVGIEPSHYAEVLWTLEVFFILTHLKLKGVFYDTFIFNTALSKGGAY